MAKLICNIDGVESELAILGEITIGRLPTNKLQLANEKMASRNHAVIRIEGTEYVLEDLKSGNGTLVGGEKVDRYILMHGDVIQIGGTLITLINDPKQEHPGFEPTLVGELPKLTKGMALPGEPNVASDEFPATIPESKEMQAMQETPLPVPPPVQEAQTPHPIQPPPGAEPFGGAVHQGYGEVPPATFTAEAAQSPTDFHSEAPPKKSKATCLILGCLLLLVLGIMVVIGVAVVLVLINEGVL